MTEQLAAALKADGARVIDLFRDWDEDGDGEISRAEFHRAMPALGYEVPKAAVDALFGAWRARGSNRLEPPRA